MDLGVGSLQLVEFSQPNVKFASTVDGLGIAYWEIGSGPPLVIAQQLSGSHAELEWSVPSMKALYLELAKYFRLVRFDPRGSGMSDEPSTVADFSTAGFGRDIDAVVDALELDEFNLCGAVPMGPVVIQYAVEHPERVTGLVLCDTGPTLADTPLANFALAQSAAAEFGIVPSYGKLSLHISHEELAAFEEMAKVSTFGRLFATHTMLDLDAADLMGQVGAPTLVMRSRESVFADQEQTRRLVAGIPGAQMRIVPGTMAPWVADLDSVVEAFVTFLTSDQHHPSSHSDDEMRTIVFTDLVSSTETLSYLGDEKGRAEFRDVEQDVAELSVVHHGQLVKNLGDGSLISFRSTQRALIFALDLQKRMEKSNFGMRIGMTAGEPIQEDDDIHGAVVVQASRIADLGQAGEILVADSVRQMAIGKGFNFDASGEVQLKGFDEQTTLWKVTDSARP